LTKWSANSTRDSLLGARTSRPHRAAGAHSLAANRVRALRSVADEPSALPADS